MTPASRLPIEPGDFVLDLCAAPGGKATALGAALNDTGFLLANDISTSRARALLRNLELFGMKNMLVTDEKPAKLAKALCFNALESFEYIKARGCKFSNIPFIQGGHSCVRSLAPEVGAGISVLIPLHQCFTKAGGVMRKNTIVDEVIKVESGRAIGVAVRENYQFDINSRDNDLTNTTGVRKYYRSTKGIIFAAGGFVNDWRLCSMIDPKITKDTEGTNYPGATAGALFTLMRAGGVPVHIDYI